MYVNALLKKYFANIKYVLFYEEDLFQRKVPGLTEEEEL